MINTMNMKLNKSDAENIMKMFTSNDDENHYMAFKSIESFVYDNEDVGFLIYFYKFSGYSIEVWRENCPASCPYLENVIPAIDKPLTYSAALSIMIANKVNRESIELFLERHVKNLETTLKDMGYPVNYLKLDISLK